MFQQAIRICLDPSILTLCTRYWYSFVILVVQGRIGLCTKGKHTQNQKTFQLRTITFQPTTSCLGKHIFSVRLQRRSQHQKWKQFGFVGRPSITGSADSQMRCRPAGGPRGRLQSVSNLWDASSQLTHKREMEETTAVDNSTTSQFHRFQLRPVAPS